MSKCSADLRCRRLRYAAVHQLQRTTWSFAKSTLRGSERAQVVTRWQLASPQDQQLDMGNLPQYHDIEDIKFGNGNTHETRSFAGHLYLR